MFALILFLRVDKGSALKQLFILLSQQ